MNAPYNDRPSAADIDRYRAVRAATVRLSEGLSAEDLAAQAMPDASPGKWHLAHSSWFFEAMILARAPDYRPVDARLQTLFNSYYEALGERVARQDRGLMTRPSLDEVLAYRREIDRRMLARLDQGLTGGHERYLFELGLNHEQQHQELFLMDILALMARSPLDPAAHAVEPRTAEIEAAIGGYSTFDGGVVEFGAAGGFAFDNEKPRHRAFIEPFQLDHDLVTNGDWLGFMMDGGYARPELWLSDGWATVKTQGWTAPEYWRQETDGGWTTMSLTGRRAVDTARPVRHVSFYEADAFARWSGKRLPTEAEWEAAATSRTDSFSNLFGEVWQWTAAAYQPYPGFRPTAGTAAEYNGKFMANQMVLRGSSFATPPGHARATYRNFFYPHQRWAFTGVRLASDASIQAEVASDDDETAAFRRDLIEGLSRPQKAVPPKWFYDAEGSRLFEAITRLPEYYPTRQEKALLRQVAPELAQRFGPGAVLVEFGSGASEKTRIVLDAAPDLAVYAPIDISPTALAEAADRIRAAYPDLTVRPTVGDFEALGDLPDDLPDGRRVGFFPGSTIGNLAPSEAIAFLAEARRMLGPGALFVLGVDLVKEPAVLVRAYDDAEGVTAAFNRNLLIRANRQLSAGFDIDGFTHEAVWDAGENRIEMHLKALYPMSVLIGARAFDFTPGETLHTESSRKFTPESLSAMVEAAGWRLLDLHVSDAPSVALAVLEA